MSTLSKGRYILIDSPDGCGKTTLINRLKEEYPDFVYVKEPGDERFESTRKIREIVLHSQDNIPPEAEMYLFLADRLILFEYIKQQLENGKTVISDRSFCASIAYQSSEEISAGYILDTYSKYLNKALPHIDSIVILRLKQDIQQERLELRNQNLDRMEQKSDVFMKKVINIYNTMRSFIDIYSRCSINDQNRDDYSNLAEKIHYLDANQSADSVYRDFRAKFL